MRPHRLLAFSSLVAASFAACGTPTSSNRPCNEDPFSCSPGLTCWVNASQQFACVTAGAKNEGEACTPTPGETSPCGEDLMCVQLQSGGRGTCVAFCDNAIPGRECVTGTCTQVSASQGGTQKTRVCLGGTPVAVDAGTTSTDAGAISDAKTDG